MNAIVERRSGFGLQPQNFDELMRFAEVLAGSDLVPGAFKNKVGNVLVAIQWGYEVGLGPLQAVQNIAVINGRPAIWGDAALALVRAHPACEGISETTEGEGDQLTAVCIVKRRGEEPVVRRFSMAQAKKAKLWEKEGTWKQYPERMLQMRARGFAIRDAFPDALRGVMTIEEAQDTPAEPREVKATVVPNPPSRDAAPARNASLPADPMPAANGSKHPAQDPLPDALPIFGTDRNVYAVRAKNGSGIGEAWKTKAMDGIRRMDAADMVRNWIADMGSEFPSIAKHFPNEVADVKRAAHDRVLELSMPAAEPREGAQAPPS